MEVAAVSGFDDDLATDSRQTKSTRQKRPATVIVARRITNTEGKPAAADRPERLFGSYTFLISEMSPVSDAFASPNSIAVFLS